MAAKAAVTSARAEREWSLEEQVVFAQASSMKGFYTLGEAAEWLAVGVCTVRDMIADGTLAPAVRSERVVRITSAELIRYAASFALDQQAMSQRVRERILRINQRAAEQQAKK